MQITFTKDYTVLDDLRYTANRTSYYKGQMLECSPETGYHFISRKLAVESIPSVQDKVVDEEDEKVSITVELPVVSDSEKLVTGKVQKL